MRPGRYPTRYIPGLRDNGFLEPLRFGHKGVVHLRVAKHSPARVDTLCGLMVAGEDKQLRMKATYDPPADAEVCQACVDERNRWWANYEKRTRRAEAPANRRG